MNSTIIFIYDGECPFCNHFAQLIELKSGLPNLQIKNARENPQELPIEYDMDTRGAILFNGEKQLEGAEAINWICSKIENPSAILLKILTINFKSKRRTDILFPLLIVARRIALTVKNVPRKLNHQ